jgi:hypothetical protein
VDLARLRKIYKLNAGPSAKDTKEIRTGAGDSDKSSQQMNGYHKENDEFEKTEAVILGIMALKGS